MSNDLSQETLLALQASGLAKQLSIVYYALPCVTATVGLPICYLILPWYHELIYLCVSCLAWIVVRDHPSTISKNQIPTYRYGYDLLSSRRTLGRSQLGGFDHTTLLAPEVVPVEREGKTDRRHRKSVLQRDPRKKRIQRDGQAVNGSATS
jgi:hypothetical protein